tara:strand:+ start:3145 stop:3915 length:771 start_codon:yes stop_codon:yes gene_type:complete
MTEIDEDYQAWDAYPESRWIFNKLELSLKLGYNAGPACVPVKEAGKYIVRPIYNLYGMGVGTSIKYLDPILHGEEMTHHKHVPPGHFWCELFEGDHLSIDLKKVAKHSINGNFQPFCTVRGTQRNTEKSLVTFDSWTKVDNIKNFKLPEYLNSLETEYLNIEMIGDKIIEVHLRTGNDFMWEYPIGTIVYPIWDTDEIDEKTNDGYHIIKNHHNESYHYAADGHLDHIRLGYRIRNMDYEQKDEKYIYEEKQDEDL